MAIFALTNSKVTVAGVTLSSYCTSATIKVGAAKLDVTAFSSTAWEASIQGLKNWSLDLEFNDDFATTGADKTFWDAIGTGTAFAITYMPISAGSPAATTPEFQGNCVAAYDMTAGGKVGSAAMMSVSLSGTGALTRAVA